MPLPKVHPKQKSNHQIAKLLQTLDTYQMHRSNDPGFRDPSQPNKGSLSCACAPRLPSQAVLFPLHLLEYLLCIALRIPQGMALLH